MDRWVGWLDGWVSWWAGWPDRWDGMNEWIVRCVEQMNG